MKYLGDLTEDQIVDFKFSTHQADGTPITLGGTPIISVYKANGAAETLLGVTLTVDFDGKVGCHHVRIDTSDAFYAVANDYQVVITTGTVNAISVVGTVLAVFSIENRFIEAVVTTNNDKTGYVLSAAGNEAIWAVQTAVLSVVDSIGKFLLDRLDVVLSTRASTGAAMTLTAGERIAVANEIENQIIDETDSEKVLEAITNKIAAVNPDLSGLTLGAIASAVRTNLAIELARIDNAISTRMATFVYVTPPTTGQIVTAMEADGNMLEHLHEMTEDDGGVRRLTANALELGPTGTISIDVTTGNKIADYVIRRKLANVRASADGDVIAGDDTLSEGRSLLGAASKLVNKLAPEPSPDEDQLIVYQEDDATPYWSQTVVTESTAEPIISVSTND